MKVAFDAKRIFHNNTGLGNYGRDVVRMLTQSPEIEELYLFNPKKSTNEKLVALDKATIVYPKGWFWKKAHSIWRLLGQWIQAKKLPIDGFHGLSGEIPIQLRRNSIPKVVTIHDLIFLSHPHYYNIWDRVIYTLKFKYAVKTSNHVIAISEQTKRDIVKYFKIAEEKISVVYQGCNKAFKVTYLEEDKNTIRKKFNLPKEFIINVGTLQERKNALTLIKAVNGTNHHLVLVGKDKKYAKQLYAYVTKHHLEKQVTFVKDINVTELATLYQAATVFCYPSICEGFGIPIIEAMYSKTPVIVTNDGCFPEAAGPNSIYINPNDTDEIRAKLNWIFEHPEERKVIAEKGYTYVQQFSDKNVLENLLTLYKQIF